jgi:hypothetical protein
MRREVKPSVVLQQGNIFPLVFLSQIGSVR